MRRPAKWCLCQIIILLAFEAACHEKTLRKIVRDKFKMIQRPFSESNSPGSLAWSQADDKPGPGARPVYTQDRSLYQNRLHSRISTILSSVETMKGKSSHGLLSSPQTHKIQIGRTTRNPYSVQAFPSPTTNTSSNLLFESSVEEVKNNSLPEKDKVPETGSVIYYAVKNELVSDKMATFYIPEKTQPVDKKPFVKAIYSNTVVTPTGVIKPKSSKSEMEDPIEAKPDFMIEVSNQMAVSFDSVNETVNMMTCSDIDDVQTDIDSQEKYYVLDQQLYTHVDKSFWNHIFESRYETLMRDAKWPPLKVILIPRSHVDSIWRQTFDQYHKNSVYKIISNAIKKLNFYSNLTFSWNEVSHLSQWWKSTTHKNRSSFRRLVKSGRLEITAGGWVETDEATSHIFGMVHQLIEGHQWLRENLNYSPKVAWLTNSVTHSPTMMYLLAASGIHHVVLTNVNYLWERFLSEYQYSDFIWVQNWDNDKTSTNLNEALLRIGPKKVPKNSVFVHFLQYNSAGFKSCGPNKSICLKEFDFAKTNKNLDINAYNVKEKAELLLEQYSKTGTLSPHNVVVAPIGGPYRYERQSEFDYQYNNYKKLADFINMNKDIYKASIEFGTAADYFNTVLEKHKDYPTFKGDFMNFADILSETPAYWTGYFTSRPMLKIMLRRLQSTLRSTEILFSFAINYDAFEGVNATEIFELLLNARTSVARLSDRHVTGGTLSINALRSVYNQILRTTKDCWNVQEVSASLLSVKPDKEAQVYLQKYLYRDGEFISVFRSVAPGDSIYVFNSLSHQRTELVELVTMYPSVRILDHNDKELTIQVNPIWKFSKKVIKISRRLFKVIFIVVIPPLTMQLFKIKNNFDIFGSAATIFCSSCLIDDLPGDSSLTFPFVLHPVESGDIQLESYKHRLIFDERTAFLKTIVQKETGQEKKVILDYHAFVSSDKNAGMFLFNTNKTKPTIDVLLPYRMGVESRVIIITAGMVSTDLTAVFGRLLQHTVKLFNVLDTPLSSAIQVESKVDYETSPKYREMEFFLSLQTDICNGVPAVLYTDNNGFQYVARSINASLPLEPDVYPMTTMAFIQDEKTRLTLVTEHAHGVTALQEGQLVALLDRRVLFNDHRGTDEGLADSTATVHKHIILLENLNSPNHNAKKKVILPSLAAIHLSNVLSYTFDIFLIEKNYTQHCYYTYYPLIKVPFPCDVSVLNFRTVISKECRHNSLPNAALLVLHRQTYNCDINNAVQLNCDPDTDFYPGKIFRNIKNIRETNLVGSYKGANLIKLDLQNFPPMEIVTLWVHF